MIDHMIQIIDTVKAKITDTSDLRTELENYITQLRTGDRSCLQTLANLFSPKGSFQEHAINNNWGAGFFLLSSRFDGLYADLKDK